MGDQDARYLDSFLFTNMGRYSPQNITLATKTEMALLQGIFEDYLGVGEFETVAKYSVAERFAIGLFMARNEDICFSCSLNVLKEARKNGCTVQETAYMSLPEGELSGLVSELGEYFNAGDANVLRTRDGKEFVMSEIFHFDPKVSGTTFRNIDYVSDWMKSLIIHSRVG